MNMKSLFIITLFFALSCNTINRAGNNKRSSATVGGVIGGTTIVATMGILVTHYVYEQRKSGGEISAKGFWHWLIKNHKTEAFAYAAALAGGLFVGYINANAALEGYQENQFSAAISKTPDQYPERNDEVDFPYGKYL